MKSRREARLTYLTAALGLILFQHNKRYAIDLIRMFSAQGYRLSAVRIWNTQAPIKYSPGTARASAIAPKRSLSSLRILPLLGLISGIGRRPTVLATAGVAHPIWGRLLVHSYHLLELCSLFQARIPSIQP